MLIKLAYGDDHLTCDVPDNWINGRCYRPHPLPDCADVRAELMSVLAGLTTGQTLREIGDEKADCVIAVEPDCPAILNEVLPALIEMIEDETTLDSSHITILIANRVLNPITPSQIPELIPAEIREHYRVVVHNPFSKEKVHSLGESSRKLPLSVNSIYHSAELKIILSSVRPDMLLGFTGARSVVLPGLSSKETLKALYGFNFVADRNARYGNFRDNPFHIAGVEATNAAGCNLALNAVIAPTGNVSRIFAGHFGQSQLMAMNFMREAMTVKVKEPMDVVVTSAGGAPGDNTMTQLINTLSAVSSVLKPEGTIVIAAKIGDGFGSAELARLFQIRGTVHEAVERLSGTRTFVPGQWLAQRLYALLQSHEVIIYNTHLDEDSLWGAGLTPAQDINQAVHEAMQSHGQKCKIVALPDGPFGIGEIVTPG
ncbi:DUF2088 domain-containing protein [bacterium]|nr:DUF2088 domain-containing protein [bacterium]